jgi:hypothetical protein
MAQISRIFLGLPSGSGISGLEKLDSRDFLDWASGFFIEMPDFPRFAFRIREFLENPRFPRFAFRIRDFGARKARFSRFP